jgi:NADPH:quinone reductase-like Zn-dependent oxidoreductase
LKAIRIHEFGGPDKMLYEDTPDPAPGEGEVLVRVKAAGVNPVDIAIASGKHPASARMNLPYIPGVEAAGVVEAAGPGVAGLKEGDSIYGRTIGGSYCELTRIAETEASMVPDGFSFEEAASIPIVFMTAWQSLFNKADTQPGETVLIQAGGGGVGSAAIQLAKWKGATVLTTVGSAEKAGRAKALGADHVILYKETPFDEEVLRLTEGQGADVIIETVAAENLPRDISALKIFGRIVIIGNGTGKGPEATLPVGPALFKDLRILSMTMFNAGPQVAGILKGLAEAFAGGQVRPLGGGIAFPLEKAAEAHKALLAGAFFGKIVLSPVE